jgi:hypothetical protein
MRRRGAPVGALCVAVAILASACGGPSNNGPLGKVGPDGNIGAPGPLVAIGTDIFTNKSSKPVTTQSATLDSPVGLKLVTTFILPLHGDESFGTSHYPVPKSFLEHALKGVNWSARHAVAGAVIQPKEQAEVVAVVQMTGKRDGTAKAVTINYSQSGHHYFRVGPNALDVNLDK